MRWHTHYYHVLVIATHPGVTSQELTNRYGLPHSNHRMVIHRLTPDLVRLELENRKLSTHGAK